ncbi:MAG TPA: hypothetical protein VIG51_13515 [Candidatus Baltobacteraceae bacterium]|jgi:streptogramin lyase
MKQLGVLMGAVLILSVSACGSGGSGTAAPNALPAQTNAGAPPAASITHIEEFPTSDTLLGGLTIGSDGSLYATTTVGMDIFSAYSLQATAHTSLTQSHQERPFTWPAVGKTLAPTGAIAAGPNGTVGVLASGTPPSTPAPSFLAALDPNATPALVTYTIATKQFTIAFGVRGDTYQDITAANGALWLTADTPTSRGLTGYLITTKTGCSSIRFTVAIGSIGKGPDGAIYVATDPQLNPSTPSEILRVDSNNGAVTQTFALPLHSRVTSLTAGPDGALWFTDAGLNSIGRLSLSGAVTYYAIPTADSAPGGIVSSGSALWFTESQANKIGRVTTTGTITEFVVPTPNAGLGDMAACSCSLLYFTETHAIGKITP